MTLRRTKLMHYPCQECGKKFERIGRYTRFCKTCRDRRIAEGQKKGAKMLRKAMKEKWGT